MITVTANAFHEKLHVQEDEITLNGPPGFLTGSIFISNKDTETLFIRDLPLSQSTESGSWPNMPTAFKFITSLRPGEERVHRISYQAPSTTPPGIYESTIHVGGREKKLKMIIQPNIDIELNPINLYFHGVSPGQTYNSELSLTNSGNVSFKIPDIKHTTTLDSDYLCRATALAIREKGNEGFMATMDELTKNIHKEMADWATIHLEESGRIIEPGESIQLHFSLTMPGNVDSRKDYYGNVRLWNKILAYNIKSHDGDPSEKY